MNILYVFNKNIKTFYIIKNTLNMAYFKLFYGIFCEIQTKG